MTDSMTYRLEISDDDLASTTPIPEGMTLLADLDRRQNHVLSSLDLLNEQIVFAIDGWSRLDVVA